MELLDNKVLLLSSEMADLGVSSAVLSPGGVAVAWEHAVCRADTAQRGQEAEFEEVMTQIVPACGSVEFAVGGAGFALGGLWANRSYRKRSRRLHDMGHAVYALDHETLRDSPAE